VFQESASDWPTHLNALTVSLKHLDPTSFNLLPTDRSNPVTWEHAALEFFIGVVIWLDIIGALCLRRVPHTLYNTWLLHSTISVDEIIGYQNRVLAVLGDIATVVAQPVAHGEDATTQSNSRSRGVEKIEESLLHVLGDLEMPSKVGDSEATEAISITKC
jgi:hypothetical protein